MAQFNIAFRRTNRFEGFYANDPKDTGGETLYGISRKKGASFPEFWRLVDEYKKKPNFPNNMKAEPRFKQMIEGWYKRNYWDPQKLDEIRSQPLANQIYDIAVNKGNGVAVSFMVRLVNMNTNSINNEVIKRLNDNAYAGNFYV